MNRRPPLAAVAVLSGAALAYEVLLLRLFAIIQWHHFAYLAISVALLGIGAAGTFVTLARRRLLAASHEHQVARGQGDQMEAGLRHFVNDPFSGGGIGKGQRTTMAGGDLSKPTWVSEQYILDLEREAFLSLCSEEKTQARMWSILQTDKPLRN